MHRTISFLLIAASFALSFTFGSAPAADVSVPKSSRVDFSRDILPILSENCFRCHGPDEKARKAKLRLDRHEGALRVIVPGKSGDSELIRRVTSNEPEEVMPPPKTKRTLSSQQKELLRRWVDQGAPWGKHWAYESLHRPPVPVAKSSSWCRNEIDRFVLARLEREGLSPCPKAARETLLRRVTLDLTGLPPSLEEIDAFLSDPAPDAYEDAVDRLLASPRYGERMATSWLDAARYADTNGYQNDFARSMWPWRDWVIGAFNRNLPFDQFLVEQLAGDLLPGATVEQRIATGFNRNNRTVTEAGSIDEEWRVENAVDRVETTSTVFLGLTMGCCRCHDHKYDPLTQREFYGFLAFFNSINEKGVYTEQPGNVPPLVSLPSDAQREHVKKLEAAIALAERKAAPKKDKEAEKRLAALQKEKEEYEKQITTAMVMEDLPKPRDTFVLKRGRYDMPDPSQKVNPGVPSILGSLPTSLPRNRLGLARWLVSPANPLTARVMVNRLWQQCFGIGLVKTAENFGVQGEMPSHPELLDWLASEFIRTGWDIKATLRLIVTSATYRQSSVASSELLRRDPENRLLARGPRFRLPAEAVRDNALAISGLLTEELGGPSVKPYQPAGLWEELAGGAGEGPYIQEKGPNLYRRSLYVYRKRTVPHPLLATFDAPSREICEVKLQRTDTPLQALALLNDDTYVEAARRLAERMLSCGKNTPEDRITQAFRRATARKPTPKELHVLVQGLERYLREFRANTAAARQFLHHGESPPNERFEASELAAYTAVASILLNMDEMITRE
jgi:Protein of unknown function (DUF1553)/Protein of unknown function (DUF1549)/Planctomycete cytochrome C